MGWEMGRSSIRILDHGEDHLLALSHKWERGLNAELGPWKEALLFYKDDPRGTELGVLLGLDNGRLERRPVAAEWSGRLGTWAYGNDVRYIR